MLSNIQPDSEQSWRDTPKLTIDLDWANEGVIHDTLDLLEPMGVAATWFVTHGSVTLPRILDNPLYEVGIHPNFNKLLIGTAPQRTTYQSVISELMDIVPEARVSRSHSLVQSSRFLEQLATAGITHDSSTYIPAGAGVTLKPWISSGIIRVPFFWADDAACSEGELPMTDILESLGQSGLRVYDFHPIHIFLNSSELDTYESTRQLHQDPKSLIEFRNPGQGTRTRFLQLLEVISGSTT